MAKIVSIHIVITFPGRNFVTFKIETSDDVTPRAVIDAAPLDPVALPAAARASDVETKEAVERLPLPVRMRVIVAAAVGAWALLIGVGWAIFALARTLLS